jgi:cell wall assembly regulator SMI1
MSEDLVNAVATAVKEAYKARSRFYSAMSEPDEQRLGAPAPEVSVRGLEKALGLMLPPSYRAFLLLHDGWKMVDAATDLYSCSELISTAGDPRTKKWRKIAVDHGDSFANSGIVIGGSKFSASKYLLDPLRTNGVGEMPVIEYDKGGIEETYDTFLEFLIRSSRDFLEAAGDIEDGGYDFSNI